MLRARVSHREGDTVLQAASGNDLLLLSMRNLARLVGYCAQYEFEDVISSVTGADRVLVGGASALEWSRRAYKAIRLATGSPRFARNLTPPPAQIQLQRNYELFFPIFNHPYELHALSCVPEWRSHCRLSACFINEVWVHDLPHYLLELLSEFDHIFIGMRHSVDAVAQITKRPCTYLPMAADVLTFSPWPSPGPRTIDVCNVGRRSPVTHATLVELTRERFLFCYFDTFSGGADKHQRTFFVEDPAEHRLLLANLLRRTRYYIAHRSRVNQTDYTGNRQELSGRFFEGAAAGTVMIGEAPALPEFAMLFDWPDALVHVPFDCPEIGRVIAELDRDPERILRIRCQNAAQSALRHDWVHRLHSVFDVLGLPATRRMIEREERLRALAERASAALANGGEVLA
jgi:hypothetical protein